MYFTPPSTASVRDAITTLPGLYGAITTPRQGNRIESGWAWIADTGCFGNGYPGDREWLEWLDGKPDKHNCLFATAPDVICDAKATLKRSAPMLPVIRELGCQPAFVIQNGITPGLVPWDERPVIFIGGDDEFKTSREARRIVDMALADELEAHMGRVNTKGRLLDAARMGCSTADGRTLALFPASLGPVTRWLRDGRVQQQVFRW